MKTVIEHLKLQDFANIQRDTNSDLFTKTYEMAEKAGELKKLIQIEDYHLPNSYDLVKLTDYRFNVSFVANYGCEGIYINGYIFGIFDESKKNKHLSIGNIKTLERSLDAMKIMGEACGILTHFADKYVNSNLARYTSVKELKRNAELEARKANQPS